MQKYDESRLQAGIDEDNAANWQFDDDTQYELLGGYVNVKKLPNGRVRSPNFNAGRGDTDLVWSSLTWILYVLYVLA